MIAMPLLDALARLSVGPVTWRDQDRPVLVADGMLHRVRTLEGVVRASAAYVVGVNQRDLERLARSLRTTAVSFYEMRVDDLGPLASLGEITDLSIHWNTKLVDLAPLAGFRGMTTLSIVDTPKVRDLRPIGSLARLRALDYSGGIWNRSTAETFEPIGRLAVLEELRLTNVRVLEGGLRPLAGCTGLRRIDLSNQFQTADYAYLSVALPETTCDKFAPYVRLGQSIGGNDVMVVGSGKPFLHSTRDAARLQRYHDAFRRLQDGFAAERSGAGSTKRRDGGN